MSIFSSLNAELSGERRNEVKALHVQTPSAGVSAGGGEVEDGTASRDASSFGGSRVDSMSAGALSPAVMAADWIASSSGFRAGDGGGMMPGVLPSVSADDMYFTKSR